MLLRREADIDAHDHFLPLVLGMQSAMQRLDSILETVPAEPAEGGDHRPSLDPEGRAIVDLLLGLVSLRDRWRGHLLREGPAPRPAASTDAVGTVAPSRGRSELLR